jgi:hypothetical protein
MYCHGVNTEHTGASEGEGMVPRLAQEGAAAPGKEPRRSSRATRPSGHTRGP